MENNRIEQLEALTTLAEFNDRLLKNLPIIISELSGNRQPDTDKYLQNIINAINWEIAVTNATLDVLNEGQERVNKESFNQEVLNLNSALSSGEDAKTAAVLENLVPYFEGLGNAAKEVTQ